MGFVEFVKDRWAVLSFLAYQHMSLVLQTLVVAAVCAVFLGVLIYRSPWGVASGNALAAIGLTIPSYALLGCWSASSASVFRRRSSCWSFSEVCRFCATCWWG